MKPSPSFSDPYNLNYTISIAAAKSGFFGAESDQPSSDAFDGVDEVSTDVSSRTSSTASGEAASDGGIEPSMELYELTRKEDGEQLEKEYEENRSKENAQLEQVQKQKPSRSPNSVRTEVSESSQSSKIKLFKKRISNLFQPGHKNKTDAHLMLVTSYSQHSGVSTSYTPSTSAYSKSTGNKGDSVLRTNNNEGENNISIQRKRRFPIFARIAGNHHKLVKNAVRNSTPEDKIPETVSSSESGFTDFQQILSSDDNNILMNKVSQRTYVINDDSESVALSSVRMSNTTANFCFPCDAICCSQHECDFIMYDDETIAYTVDEQSEASDCVAYAVDAIQKHAARLGMSEHELIEKVRQDREL